MDYRGAKDFILNKLRKELSPTLHYHGIHHTMDVLVITEQLCLAESITPYDTLLLKTAALYHDAGFIRSSIEHERHSCDIARENLPEFHYPSQAIEKICGMIMATKIPQTPRNFLEEIICDADLDYLGRNDFYTIGHTLFQELKANEVLETEEAWNRLQLKFLKEHHFFTSTSQNKREKKKLEHLSQIEEIVAQYS
jgi:predicted metal-dependent HD superfamily phosphohydrolase